MATKCKDYIHVRINLLSDNDPCIVNIFSLSSAKITKQNVIIKMTNYIDDKKTFI